MTSLKKLSFLLSLLLCQQASAQLAASPVPMLPVTQQTVEVTTTIPPIPLSESNRAVEVLDTRDQPLLFNNFTDYLRQDPSLTCRHAALTAFRPTSPSVVPPSSSP